MAQRRPPDVQERPKAALRGEPSYVWRAGQERRLAFIRDYAPLKGQRILDIGCGIGAYVNAFRRYSTDVVGIDVDEERVREGGRDLPNLLLAVSEHLPFRDGSFDVVLLNEVIEHVADDERTLREACRVTAEGGYVLVYAPNRLYPFETHGAYWRGRYHFGNIPLINYLPNPLRNRLAPHVRAYTGWGLRRLTAALPMRLVHHGAVYPGFDNVIARHPKLGRLLLASRRLGEATPLQWFGISHFIVLQKRALIAGDDAHG